MARSPSTPHDVPAPDLDLGLVDGVVQLSFSVQEILAALAAEFDLSITQVRMLGVLRDRTPSMLELARFLTLEKSSVTGLVDRAEQRGLVARTRGGGDGRTVHVQLAPAGRRAAGRYFDELSTRIGALVGALSQRDQAQLSKLASRLVVQHAGGKGIDLAV